MSGLDVDAVRHRAVRFADEVADLADATRISRAAQRSAADVPVLLAEVKRLRAANAALRADAGRCCVDDEYDPDDGFAVHGGRPVETLLVAGERL